RDLHGLEYDRDALEAALQDFTRAAALGDGSVHDYRCAKLAEQLGDYELATRHYDHMLARLPADAGNREHVRSERDRCAQGEAGARAATAELFEQMAATASSERSLGEDMFHSINQGVATMVRHGADVPSALDALVGDDSPDGLTATHIAIQIYNYGHEPDPDLIEVSAADYPRYQRAHANACTKPMAAQGYVHLGDVEAQGLTQFLGQSVLVRLFVNPEFGSAAAFALKPKWPGLVGFVLALLTGKWKTARMLECMTRFEDGVFMGSRAAGPDPFDNNGDPRIAFETLPTKATPKQVTQRHLERVKARLAEGHAVCTVDSVATVDCHWAENTAIKREYRQGLGYITDAEMRALLGVHHDRLAGTIRARLNALAST
ncbi:MAG: hypothetical protein IT467_02190, partial [Dokdonella sp.]|nr:hypothetical protein [Dokdonella sp.]